MPDLDRAVTTVITRFLGVREGEQVTIVVDGELRDLGDRLRDAATAVGAEAVTVVQEPRGQDGNEPPAAVAAALAASDVFVCPTTRSLSHTRARKAASDAGARGATLPGVTPDMLARLTDVDVDALTRRSTAVAEILSAGSEARITCPRGSDLRLDLTGREATCDDGVLTAPGAFGNLPAGEGFLSPVSGQGRMVTGSLAAIGLPAGELPALTVRDGHLVEATEPEGERLLAALTAHGEPGTNVAELGVGTNPAARLSGNILEDEKMLGTVHVAFGASAGIGGTVAVPVHLDCLVLDATLVVDGTDVLRDGRLVVGG